MRPTLRRLLAYGTDVAVLAAVLLPLAFFAMSESFERVGPIQLVVAGSSYALMAAYLIVALMTGGRRSVPDLVAGSRVVPVREG